MRKKKIILEWKEFGHEHSKTVAYKDISYYMEGLKKGFQTDNEVSTKILKVLPQVKHDLCSQAFVSGIK